MDGLIEVLNGPLILAQDVVRKAAAAVGGVISSVNLDGPVEVLDGPLVLAQAIVGKRRLL